MMMGGRIAEQLYSGDISSGAAGDIQQATKMAKSMVTQFGMSDKLGMVQYGGSNEYVFLGRDMAQSKDYSEDTAQQIDDEVKRIITECYKCAEILIKENREKLKIIAEALLEYESLDGAQVKEIVRTGKFNKPKKDKKSDGSTGAEAATPTNDVSKKEPPETDKDIGTGSPAPAPA
jgi:cell division protease FtsH